jgi:hypothetical protein
VYSILMLQFVILSTPVGSATAITLAITFTQARWVSRQWLMPLINRL